jgi:primosomal protein N' (replication factor Y)
MTQQSRLFDTEPEPWQLDDQGDWIAARIVFAEPPFGPYDYLVPGELEQSLQVGARVRVPLGRGGGRTMIGYCIDKIGINHPLRKEINPGKLKPIQAVIDPQPLLRPGLLPLAKWISEYYLCPLGSVIETVVPTGVRDQAGSRELVYWYLAPEHEHSWSKLKLTELQRQILDVIQRNGEAMTAKELAEATGCSGATVAGLKRRGILERTTRRVVQRAHAVRPEEQGSNHQLNSEQQAALDRIESAVEAGRHETFLMLGITGSGKTEVYIRAIQKVVSHGRQAIVLVPEISLTPQTRQRFRARFERVAVLHSHLTAAERSWHWNQIAEGQVDVVIGARSAIFAPTPRLGLVVIDEEHDGSFKQDKAPRYHAREVAQWRAAHERAPLVLGSATPSLESYQRARRGEYQLLSLHNRVLNLPLPDVATIDMRLDFAQGRQVTAISQKLKQEIRRALDEGGQVILLLNRRGFATRVQCPGCGEAIYCPDCSIPMTHHKDGAKLACHYCDFEQPQPDRCPKCGFEAIRFSGLGTQRLELIIKSLFPEVPLARMDTDTMKRPGSHEEALNKFRKGETRILLGTQMIAKGLDFPDVTLVGVVNADSALHFPDFRAGERTFGLVTQVAGRSGRGAKGGRVLVQTFSPDHPAIVAATRHDYEGFARYELPIRESTWYPPFGNLARMVVRSESESAAESWCRQLADRLQATIKELGVQARVVGPAPAPVTKLRGKFRFHLLLSAPLEQPLQPLIQTATAGFDPPAEEVQWIVDIDPQDLL